MSGGSIKNRRLLIDDQIPEEQWSDARRQYIMEEKKNYLSFIPAMK